MSTTDDTQHCQRCGRPADELVMSIQLEEVCAECLAHLEQPAVQRHVTENLERRGLDRVRDAIRRARGEDHPPTPPQGFA